MAPLYGYAGKLLRVDLTKGRVSYGELDEETAREYLGGAGLGAKILYDEVSPEVKWDDPDNRLILASGPLGGTQVGGSGTFCVATKGALTEGATSTQANGFFGAYLKFAGFDAVIAQGASPRWVYLFIHDGIAELRDASALVGKDTWETDEIIKAELGYKEKTMSIFCIGPAGENLVRFASIAGDKGHVAAHNGVGAVMGSKKLKAIAVARGRSSFPVYDKKALLDIARVMLKNVKEDPGSAETYNWGTLNLVPKANKLGYLPIKNYTTNTYDINEEDLSQYNGPYMREKFQAKPNPCWACQLHHCHIMKISEGPYKGSIMEEPEYEGLAAWGPATGQTSMTAAAWLANLVDRLGFDTNEAGWLVAWVMEAFEKGVITGTDTDGLEMTWGNAEATATLLHRIAYRQGVGDILAEGVMRASKHWGTAGESMAIFTEKGNSPRGHDHRSRWIELFDTSVSNTGTIETNPFVDLELFGLPAKWDPFSPKDVSTVEGVTKGSMLFEDSLGVCSFNTKRDMLRLCEAVSDATGWDFTFNEAMSMGRRATNLLRAFNIRHGLSPKLDAPSSRYGSVPIDGVAKGTSIIPHWREMLQNYYGIMGWDENGWPKIETLSKLGLENVAADLESLK